MKTDQFRFEFDKAVDAYFFNLELENVSGREKKSAWQIKKQAAGLRAQILDAHYNKNLYKDEPSKFFRLIADIANRALYQIKIKAA